ncbi:restriction endonuclease subunit S [Vibrio parahaemolyticus]|uniref:restriction endonuclease subunit S n=4 Tax=Vibrio parahaemolyticus TaxID=670 RepID=UPI00111D1C24|nr:restriction endonuclease subunit S [Vibrio parahaemolyticus]ELA9308882.1 restriction endonuclease subunit S [Vibrio parahaemolyticus]MBE4112640.1 restriction endonuclease [Vibrio parahaemolyticus]MCX8793074.1 restriction endonuclease subunit S [Vibrio parahaemolyticus]TOG14383.1 restriction endonuclease [Vibrio parahaemolyticus]TOI21498.1 restriction endonuclease [Vibrio parahaemolyticus]
MSFFDNHSNWPLVTLKDIATLKRGYDLPTKNRVEGDVPIYAANGINGSHNEVKIKGPGVITGRSGTIGKVHFTEQDYWPLNTSLYVTDFHGNDPKWVFYMLRAFQLERYVEGAGVPTLNRNLVHDELVPLPPLAEQKRIAAILDKADAIRQKRKQAIDLADEFLRSVFLDMFGDPVTNPKGWEVGTIRDLVSSVNYGSSAKASETDGEFPILRMGNITYEGKWNFTDLKYIDLNDKDQIKYLAHRNDLLFNRTNSKELVGKTAVFDEDDPMAIAGYLIRVRTNDNGNPWYISGYLNSFHGKQTLLNMCKSIVGMANINAQELQDIKIMLPPIELQNRYESIVKAVKTRSIKQNNSFLDLDNLFDSLSQKAFTGQL